MDSITVKAPAKVNLFLKILGKRKDSYHNILTVFERISLADTIRISKISKGIVVKSDKRITRDPKDNIVYKAAEAVLDRSNTRRGVKIEIRKRIPIASGLGGGSSDAASTIIGINKLFKLRLSKKVLLEIGTGLGADVPFFLLQTPIAIGKGRGDVVKAMKLRSQFWHLIVKAGNKNSTRDIYKAFDEMPKHLTPRGGSVKIRLPSNLRVDYAQAESMLHNDLERAVLSENSVIGKVSNSLSRLLARKVIVSGSGPSLFCLYRTRREAIKARDVVLKSVNAPSRTLWQIFVA